jgi:hypothetical protein
MKEIYNILDRKPGADRYYFYKQALFMADYEDDFVFRGRFSRYYPTYHVMSNDQLRGYFSWRMRFRKGDDTVESVSFLYVYLYEIFCGIGVKEPENGLDILRRIEDIAADLDDESLENNLSVWILDYVVYYNLDKKLLG